MASLTDPKDAIYHKRTEEPGQKPVVISVEMSYRGDFKIRKSTIGPRGGLYFDNMVILSKEEWRELDRAIRESKAWNS